MKSLKVVGLVILVALLSACGGGGSSSSSESGTVQLALTDAVDHNFTEVVIAIKEIRAVLAGEEPEEESVTGEVPDGEQGDAAAPEVDAAASTAKAIEGLPLIVSFDTPLSVNVLDLAFQQQLLGEAVLPAGSYSQLRLVLAANDDEPANYLAMADDPDVMIPIETPSGQTSGLKVVGGFEVGAGEITTVVLDFDPARAVVEAGNSGRWNFKPTGIRVVEAAEVFEVYGGIVGQVVERTVDETDAEVLTPITVATVRAVAADGAPLAAGQVNEEDGTFRLFLPDGDYELQVEAPGFAPRVESVSAEAEVDTDAGTLVLEPLSAE